MKNLPAKAEDTSISSEDIAFLTGGQEIVNAINKAIENNSLPQLPVDYALKFRDKRLAEAALWGMFEGIGGISNAMLWAKGNQKAFYNMFFKAMKNNNITAIGSQNLTIVSQVGDSPLDNVGVDDEGNVYDASIVDAEFEEDEDE